MISKIDKNSRRLARHRRMRGHIAGTAQKPRLNVYRSLNHTYAQIIDDSVGNTLVSASTLEAAVASEIKGKTKKEAAFAVGEIIAGRAAEKGITCVVFDRGGYLYTGRVAELAAGARKAGLDF